MMTTFNGFEIFVHSIEEIDNELFATVNKGADKTPYTFCLKCSKIKGLNIV